MQHPGPHCGHEGRVDIESGLCAVIRPPSTTWRIIQEAKEFSTTGETAQHARDGTEKTRRQRRSVDSGRTDVLAVLRGSEIAANSRQEEMILLEGIIQGYTKMSKARLTPGRQRWGKKGPLSSRGIK